ncbi:MAG: DUF1236 domain-containing protein [Marinovum algicola]|jgi:uncharacterized protein YraI|uniref:SH3 domain-containing protein n=1 Tax=Marinovum algicola TaxID=42444 RepID=A0A975ZP48_9RHOB|nr:MULTISPECIES: DUF1236 domain-containing protein [Marinovum]AKO97541.1 Bacterial SH3 domain protein/Protein of unknown function [Marinovum algicola DG 898]MDD9738630.1 DUF1236 domain-containing protein [Marinovum sp. SP66]MDD9744458.1 DUF1236 domain-containing protein [Marinovum sp. PR37]SEJ76885.1 SH3 domain-containing protein [Marinovum algicola]SLN60293.1 Bacterial SH3 domain protein [Marinovum algicola]
MFRKAILTASTAIFAAGSAAAATSATAVTDLNLRAGPGPQYEIIGVIDAEAKASVDGCIEESNWCKVTYDGQEGWAYGNYLTAMVEETPTAVIAPEVTVGTVTYDSSKDGEAFAGAGTVGAVAGALVAGPIGAVAGGLLAGSAGAYAQPDERVVTYVRTNTLDPIYLEGEVVRGAVVPESVELVEIPDAELRYVYINGQPVLVEPEQRTIVYVVR